MRTIKNGDLRISNVSEVHTLVGWVSKSRNKKMIFIDLRDLSGIVQLVIMPENPSYEIANELKNEDVIKVVGKVIERSSKNSEIKTGDIEIDVSSIEILSKSLNPPIIIADKTDALEETRLKYRYLDLRRPILANNFILRSKVSSIVRNYLENLDFLEIETPFLTKATPEGARDYVVPSRVHDHKFYALPQSPQMFKQLLMVSGFEKYYQIVKCFRDEDLRADRQPEFTQIDIEASFVSQEDIMNLGENLYKKIFKEIKNIEFDDFERMTYETAMNFYGSDKPDLRFGLPLCDLKQLFINTEFDFLKKALLENKEIRGLKVNHLFSRKEIDTLTVISKNHKASGLAFLKKENDEYSGSLAKLSDDEKASLNLANDEMIFVVVDSFENAVSALGQVRLEIGNLLNLRTGYKFVWITEWPLFEYADGRLYAAHHPFTKPSEIEKFNNGDVNTLSHAYDLVLNGYEVGGGSLRINDQEMQKKMFENLGFSEEEAINQFGFFIEALKYGTPPHGGIAFGLDRTCMILCDTENIRDVIAFPKTQSASCLMSEAPGDISDISREELNLK